MGVGDGALARLRRRGARAAVPTGRDADRVDAAATTSRCGAVRDRRFRAAVPARFDVRPLRSEIERFEPDDWKAQTRYGALSSSGARTACPGRRRSACGRSRSRRSPARSDAAAISTAASTHSARISVAPSALFVVPPLTALSRPSTCSNSGTSTSFRDGHKRIVAARAAGPDYVDADVTEVFP